METVTAKELEFEMVHIGMNQTDAAEAKKTVQILNDLFGFQSRETEGSFFVNEQFEVLKRPFLGKNGHVAIRSCDAQKAKQYLEGKGVLFDESTANYGEDGKLNTIYFKDEIAGFAFHLVQKRA